ncbi:hypothetical protein [Leifsonia shinshuensis]
MHQSARAKANREELSKCVFGSQHMLEVLLAIDRVAKADNSFELSLVLESLTADGISTSSAQTVIARLKRAALIRRLPRAGVKQALYERRPQPIWGAVRVFHAELQALGAGRLEELWDVSVQLSADMAQP